MCQNYSMEWNITVNKSPRSLSVFAFVLGFLALAIFRFITFNSGSVHYHANFAVVIDGESEQFESFAFYEELLSCLAEGEPSAKERVHMHQPDNHVAHVHDSAVSWGHFFQNLGMSLSSTHLTLNDSIYSEASGDIVSYMLNGQPIANPTNIEVSDLDRLLVVVGSETENDILSLYEAVVPRDAAELNQSSDPSTCSGSKADSFSDRLKGVFN